MLVNSKPKGAERTQGIIISNEVCSRSQSEEKQGIQAAKLTEHTIVEPIKTPPEKLPGVEINKSGFYMYEDWFQVEGITYEPGLYQHIVDGKEPAQTSIKWISSPIYIDARTCDDQSVNWGLLLRFVDPDGKWRTWAMPASMLKGSCEEMRGELLDMGLRIAADGNKLFSRWLVSQNPQKRIIAATRTGWHFRKDKMCFVLPTKIIGDANVIFQSKYSINNDFSQLGTVLEWVDNLGILCRDNPMLILGVSAAFAAPLLKLAKLQEKGGAGVHLMGDSSRGKTTVLQVAASVWGGSNIIGTWRATANGLEAIASLRNDTFLPLDESGECHPDEIGRIVYSMANGSGKQRANRNGGFREAAQWRTIILSSGECSIGTHMNETGKRIKAGQEARMLDIHATNQRFGAFDNLHNRVNARAFADELKQASLKYYGQVGISFIENLIADTRDFPAYYADICDLSVFQSSDGLESRAAGIFALLGMAGHLATEYGLTGWGKGEALDVAQLFFQSWRESRGIGKTEDRQILHAIRSFILKHGGSRFSQLNGGSIEDQAIKNRAGWRKEDPHSPCIYMFHSEALQEAAGGFEIRKILDVLENADWITDKDKDRRAKSIKINGANIRLYCICPKEEVD